MKGKHQSYKKQIPQAKTMHNFSSLLGMRSKTMASYLIDFIDVDA